MDAARDLKPRVPRQLQSTWARKRPCDWFAGPQPRGCQSDPTVALTSQIKHDGRSIKAGVCCLTDSGLGPEMFVCSWGLSKKQTDAMKPWLLLPLSPSAPMRVEWDADVWSICWHTASQFSHAWRRTFVQVTSRLQTLMQTSWLPGVHVTSCTVGWTTIIQTSFDLSRGQWSRYISLNSHSYG